MDVIGPSLVRGGCSVPTAPSERPRAPDTHYTEEVSIETTPLASTGGHTWDAAKVLFRFFERIDVLSLLQRGQTDLRLLELGSGCGWLSLNLAHNSARRRNAGVLHITATEQEGEAFEWLSHNVHLHSLNVVAKVLDWTAARYGNATDEPIAQASEHALIDDAVFDFVFGSDLIYNAVGSRCMPRVVRHFLERGQGSFFLYAHTFHRYDLLDQEFLEELENQGLTVVEIDVETLHTKQLDEVFMEEVFPEKRIAVLLIAKRTPSHADLLARLGVFVR